MKEPTCYSYRIIARDEENPNERPLAELAAEVGAIRLQRDDIPQIFFIKEDPNGYIKYASRINGYCSHDGKYICIRHGIAPKEIVATTLHELKHAFQCQDANRHKLSVEMRERDARLFEVEFWGSHSNSGDAPQLMRTLNESLQNDLDRLWKRACASARARLSKPAETESSDDLRRRFDPIIKARSLAVQRFVDPIGRGLFPNDIEFGAPRATLKLSY